MLGGLNSSKTALKKRLDCNLGTKMQNGRKDSESGWVGVQLECIVGEKGFREAGLH